MPSCTPLTVIQVGAEDVVTSAADETSPTFTGDNGAIALSGGEVTCCAEAVLTVGVKYNAQWLHDGTVNYGAQVN